MRIRWTQFATDGLNEIIDSVLERRGEDAATDVADQITGGVDRLAALPQVGPPWRPARDDRFRRLVLGEYVILYHIDDPTLLILAVRHGRRKPLEPRLVQAIADEE